MGGEDLRLAVAGGLDQPGDPLGTDAVRVVRAIEEAWSEDGVLVLMDLGSAVLSAEMALDLLPEERRGRVLLSEAPLVEGAVAAAVAAGRGATLEEAAAGGPRRPRREVGSPGTASSSASAPSRSPSGAGASTPPRGPTLRLTVKNRLGLHARPAASFVRTAAGFDADVTVSNATDGRGPVSARSLNAVATLGRSPWRRDPGPGHRATGRGGTRRHPAPGRRRLRRPAADRHSERRAGRGRCAPFRPRSAPHCSAASSAVVRADERAHRPAPSSPPARGTVLQGLPASPGIAVGAARWLQATPLEVPDAPSADPAAELEALERALVARRRRDPPGAAVDSRAGRRL